MIFVTKIATRSEVSTSLWIGFTLCSFSFIITLVLVYMDWRESLKIKMREITIDSVDETIITIVMNIKKII